MRLTITHETIYDFAVPVDYGLQQIRLTPKDRPGQRVLDWSMTFEGAKEQTHFTDQHANTVTLVSLNSGVSKARIICTGGIDTEDMQGIVGAHHGFVPLWLFQRSTPLTRGGPKVRGLAKGLRAEFDNDLPLLHALSERIREAVAYQAGETSVGTTAEDAVSMGVGVCQDHAHIFVAAARSLGIPARYVSGYLMMDDRPDQDATHAWAEAHIPALGWVGFDVSNGICPDARYVRLATGLDYREAAPMSGVRFGEGAEELEVNIRVQQQ